MSNATCGLCKENSTWTKEVKQGVREKTGFVWQVERKVPDISKEEGEKDKGSLDCGGKNSLVRSFMLTINSN